MYSTGTKYTVLCTGTKYTVLCIGTKFTVLCTLNYVLYRYKHIVLGTKYSVMRTEVILSKAINFVETM